MREILEAIMSDTDTQVTNSIVGQPGVIGYASSFLGRYREFDVCVHRVECPPGSGIDARLGVGIAKNYNDMCRTVLANHQYKWLWILGDDHVFRADLLTNLLSWNVDVVVPLCYRRIYPYAPVVHAAEADGFHGLPADCLDGKQGLVELVDKTCGNAGMLIKREVLEKMPDPWFENGKTNPELGGCDIWFCKKLHDLGIKLYIDTDNTIGHLTHVAVWPHRNEDGTYRPDIQTPTPSGVRSQKV